MLEQIKDIAEKNGVELTENAPKVAKARAMMKCPLSKCICCPNDPDMYCISPKCMDHIKEHGQCHCRCYRKKGK